MTSIEKLSWNGVQITGFLRHTSRKRKQIIHRQFQNESKCKMILVHQHNQQLTKRHCSVNLRRSDSNPLARHRLSSSLLLFFSILISSLYLGAAGRMVTTRAVKGAWQSRILDNLELYKSTHCEMFVGHCPRSADRSMQLFMASKSTDFNLLKETIFFRK